MTAPEIKIDVPSPPAVETEGHSPSATITAAAAPGRLDNPEVRERVTLSAEFGEPVARISGMFEDLDRLFQLPTEENPLKRLFSGAGRFAETATDALAVFRKRLEDDVDLGPIDMDQDGPYYRILADWALYTGSIDQELYAEINHINGRAMKMPDLRFDNEADDTDVNPDETAPS